MRVGAADRLKEIIDNLADPKLSTADRVALEEERRQIETALRGKGDDQLAAEQKAYRLMDRGSQGTLRSTWPRRWTC